MPSEPGVFDGEWWRPKWPLSSMPLPPDPEKQEPSVVRAFEADLELGSNAPLKPPKIEVFEREYLRGEEALLKTYPDRLLAATEVAARSENRAHADLQVYYFRLLRHYDLSLITHKLHHLQGQLEASRGTGISNKESQELTKLLQDQATAVRDYEYMTTHLVKCSHATPSLDAVNSDYFPEIEFLDPDITSSGQYRTLPKKDAASSRLRSAVINLLPVSLAYTKAEKDTSLYSIRPPRSISLPVRIIASTIVAVSGGALLVVPMVIMSFNTNRTKSLVTVSVSVLLFGFFLGAVMRSKSAQTFVATATYAAVLVVFVGTGGTGSG